MYIRLYVYVTRYNLLSATLVLRAFVLLNCYGLHFRCSGYSWNFLHSSRYQPLYYLIVIVYILDVLVILGIVSTPIVHTVKHQATKRRRK